MRTMLTGCRLRSRVFLTDTITLSSLITLILDKTLFGGGQRVPRMRITCHSYTSSRNIFLHVRILKMSGYSCVVECES